jgi:CBS domain-containing protein
MGVLPEGAAEADADASVEDVMAIGPTTIRPSEPLEAVSGRMAHRGVDALLVTSSDGRLLGLLVRHDAEALLADRGRT